MIMRRKADMSASDKVRTMGRIDEKFWDYCFPPGTFGGKVLFDEPMSSHTTLGLGGPAEVLAFPADALSVQNILRICLSEALELTVIGGGSNLLVLDGGIRGVTLCTAEMNRLHVLEETGDEVKIFAEAGVSLGRLVRFCAEKGYSGIEALAGIPGSFGGALRMNAGAFDVEIGSMLECMVVMDRAGGISRISGGQLRFRYRDWGLGEGLTALSGTLALKRSEPVEVLNRTTAFQRDKRERQPLSERSAGCVFKNPEASSAWKLIASAGFKGAVEGEVRISDKHLNFFVHGGRGTASEYRILMNRVIEKVESIHGIRLEPEIRIIGEEKDSGEGLS